MITNQHRIDRSMATSCPEGRLLAFVLVHAVEVKIAEDAKKNTCQE
jgi:hypothetical protein